MRQDNFDWTTDDPGTFPALSQAEGLVLSKGEGFRMINSKTTGSGCRFLRWEPRSVEGEDLSLPLPFLSRFSVFSDSRELPSINPPGHSRKISPFLFTVGILLNGVLSLEPLAMVKSGRFGYG